MRDHTSLDRVRKCYAVPRQAGGVGVRLGPAGAGFDGLCQCGSPWSCPVHAAVIGAERAREEIAPCVRHVIDEVGGSVLHVTLTVSHHAGMALADTLDAVTGAWSDITEHRRWQNLDKRHGRMGFCRGAEATWGRENGWHPHLHVLLFLQDEIDEQAAVGIGDELFEIYRSGLLRRGYTLGREHGVRAELATTRRDAEKVLSRYVSKIASEITRQDKKSGRKAGRLAPFEILRAAYDADVLGRPGDLAELLPLWAEWEQATFGRKQLTWSGKWRGQTIRERAGIGVVERTDEQVAEEDVLGSDRVLVIPTGPDHEGNWSRLRPKRTELADILEVRGVPSACQWLDRQGIAWEWPRADLTPWTGLDDAALGALLRRDAHRLLTVPAADRRRIDRPEVELPPTDAQRVRRITWWSEHRDPDWRYVP